MTSIQDTLKLATERLLVSGIEGARSEARHLLAHVLNLSVAQVFARENDPLSANDIEKFEVVLSERAAGKPFAHITNTREFWSLPFKVSPATLIPRPDSETIPELAIKLFEEADSPRDILDLGTGSGCLLCSLLTIFKEAHGVGVDLSSDALEIAALNAKELQLESRTIFKQSSWLENIAGSFDLIVSNPPYIETNTIAKLSADVREHEPHLALDGGTDGLDAYRNIIPGSFSVLRPDGVLILEVGIGQAEEVTEIALKAGYLRGSRRTDIAGIERALSFYKKRGWNSLG